MLEGNYKENVKSPLFSFPHFNIPPDKGTLKY